MILSLLGACVPQQSNGKRAKKSAASSSTTPTSTFTPVSNDNIFWYSDLTQAKNVTIDSSTLKNVYLRGTDLETFLNKYDPTGATRNYDRVFCLVVDYSNYTILDTKQMRVRAMPISIQGPTGQERMLRVEFPDSSNSEDMCKGNNGVTIPADDGTPIYGYDDDGDSEVDLDEAVFDPGKVCSNCNVIFSANSVKLFYSDGVYLSDDTQENLTGLSLSINPQNNTNNTGGTCSNSSCQALGFDCCLQGQCVDHGQSKPTALSLTSGDTGYDEYQQSQFELNSNPLAFLNYPEYYYICSNNVFLTPTPTATTDPVLEAQQELKEKAEHYLCALCDATDGSDPSNANCTSPITLAYGESVSFSAGSCTYATSQLEIVTACGCESTVNNCPGYSLDPVLNGSDQVASFACINPTPDIDPTPFQQLNVPLEAQTVPHRYFKSDGTVVDDISTLATGTTDENDSFEYADPASRLQPQITPFSMSHILGPYSLQLDKAIPAKVINVEFNETYVISTVEGFYTPCQTCARDTWFNIFSAHPTSRDGKGLYPIGHTTSRMTASTNYTFGNYEDTIFGRACWLPPTMIPFSHQPNADVQTQRLNRLKTQAALFVNGYQRDWFGFNKGAVIGSFDGVRWFAVGKGRRVTSTSTKLFLAINAAFADLASPSTMTLQILKDTGISSESIYDHDPDLNWNDPNQTEAASCRRFHQCEVDADCVSQLGWEYQCAQVTTSRTMWPKFDIDANEKVNDAQSFNYAQLLQGNVLPGSSLKRCVYRGRGAICNRDVDNMSSNSYKRNYTCAPNFYCADINTSVFNEKVARFAGVLEDIFLNPPMHLYGHDAYQLGRPYKYLGDAKALASEAVSNIAYNATTSHTSSSNQFGSDVGVCMPGKNYTSDNLLTQHNSANTDGATDYVSQIGTCNPGTTSSLTTHSDSTVGGTVTRYVGCPSFASNGDYIFFENSEDIDGSTYNYLDSSLNYDSSGDGLKLLRSQNSCSREALDNTSYISAFSTIEQDTLQVSSAIVTPMMPKNACMRRAGAICFTDLDCSPNQLHEDNAYNAADSKYGNNVAERSYWEESLVCSQADPIPLLGAYNFDAYDVKKNRCCREVGKDLTLYTQVHYGDPDEQSIQTGNLTSANPGGNNRYSRYEIIKEIGSTNYPAPEVENNSLPDRFQWKTIGETANLTCCGGGYIRKFADDTHDWTITDRLQVDIANFKCLNYANNLALFDYFGLTPPYPGTYYGDQDKMCHGIPEEDDGSGNTDNEGGCAQVDFPSVNSGVKNPEAYIAADQTDTVRVQVAGSGPYSADYEGLDSFSPFFPRAVPGYKQFFDSTFTTSDSIVKLYMPAYIQDKANLTTVTLIDPNASNTVPVNGTCTEVATASSPGVTMCGGGNCCWHLDNSTNILTIGMDNTTFFVQQGIELTYKVLNVGTGSPASTEPSHDQIAHKPGNTIYYASKFSRLEFLGIPQMMYEPIYCPSNGEQLVSGFYKNLSSNSRTGVALEIDEDGFFSITSSGDATGTVFESIFSDVDNNADSAGNNNNVVMSEEYIDHEPVFSSKDFTCCMELGKETLDKSRCCSNYAVNDSGDICDPANDSICTCKLPDATDLSVYINPFVSSEWKRKDGVVEFEDSDFDPITGEITPDAEYKLITFGQAHCASGLTRNGSTSGYFFGEPIPANGEYDTNQGEKLSIVDSYSDYDQSNGDRGAYFFLQGYRWDTHVYCNTSN